MRSDDLESTVAPWFTPEAVAEVLGEPAGETAATAQRCFARPGPRPGARLTVAAFRALSGGESLPDSVRQAAVAVQCLRSATGIHEEIMLARPGGLHERCGVPVALNVGDFLFAEGFRLLATCDAPGGRGAELLHAAAAAHRRLALAKGAAFVWAKGTSAPTPRDLIDLYSNEAAAETAAGLRIAAVLAGAPATTADALAAWAEAEGVRRRIARDLDAPHQPATDAAAPRPSLLATLAGDREEARRHLAAWQGRAREALRALDGAVAAALREATDDACGGPC